MENRQKISKKQYFILILILGTLTALSPFSIDMYLPGFPALAADLHTTTAQVSLTLSSFFIGIAGGQQRQRQQQGNRAHRLSSARVALRAGTRRNAPATRPASPTRSTPTSKSPASGRRAPLGPGSIPSDDRTPRQLPGEFVMLAIGRHG